MWESAQYNRNANTSRTFCYCFCWFFIPSNRLYACCMQVYAYMLFTPSQRSNFLTFQSFFPSSLLLVLIFLIDCVSFFYFFIVVHFFYSMDKFLLLLGVWRGGGVEGEMRQNNFYFDINVLFQAVDTVQKTFYHKNHIITNRSLTYIYTHTFALPARALPTQLGKYFNLIIWQHTKTCYLVKSLVSNAI